MSPVRTGPWSTKPVRIEQWSISFADNGTCIADNGTRLRVRF